MKLSLRWIFDHIVGDWQRIDVPQLVEKFNSTTAAIERVYSCDVSVDAWTLVQVTQVFDHHVVVFSPEWQKTLELPVRLDAAPQKFFLIKTNDQQGLSWVTLADLGAETKVGLLPALFCTARQRSGAWKKHIEQKDIIFELDNPSITHRPDLWGVRGIARECAAILGLKLRPLRHFVREVETREILDDQYEPTESGAFAIINQAPQACNRFAGLTLQTHFGLGCNIVMAQRLCKTDHRPLGALVDCANYVMFDLGQPMHTFDAQKVAVGQLVPRMARLGESLVLLDGATIKLSEHDLVITDGNKPLSLAGIMGGSDAAVDEHTTTVIVESASFAHSVIRQSSSRHMLRTDASARFEKGLDPNQITDAVKRMIHLFDQVQIPYTLSGPLVVIGKPFVPAQISVTHAHIEKLLGVVIKPARVRMLLSSIGFEVTKKKDVYTVNVPSFRGVKGVMIAEDVIEEVGRLMGYDSIVPSMPCWPMSPSDTRRTMAIRSIKHHLAYALRMHEVTNYPFFDERFLHELGWQPEHALRAKNPLSTNVTRLVTSLVPHLLLNVRENSIAHDQIRFFDCARIWPVESDSTPIERVSCAGVLWQTKTGDFYACKAELTSLFDALGIAVQWRKAQLPVAAWYDAHQVAQLVCDGVPIGVAGMSDSSYVRDHIPGGGFIWELWLDELIAHAYPRKKFTLLCKYPYVYGDISLLVSLEYTVQQFEELIQQADEYIYAVELVDMFFKDTWPDKRSLTFRYYVRDQQATLTKERIDAVTARVAAAVTKMGAQIR